MRKYPKIVISYFFNAKNIPLGSSCARALQALGCEVLCFDSGVNSPAEFFLKPANKILWNLGLKQLDLLRGSRWNNQNFRQRLLEKTLTDFRPDMLFVMRGHGFDGGYLKYLKDKYRIKKIVGWWVKGPKWLDIMISEAKLYDHFFCIHKEGYTNENGIEYLPALAVDDILYRRLPSIDQKQFNHDIVFVGGWTKKRQEIINALKDYPVAVYGPKWMKKNIFNSDIRAMIKKKGIWGEELVGLYNKTKIALNISQWDTASLSGLNLRIFDIPACSTFLLTDYSDALAEYFKPGEEIETFKDIAELRDKLSYYLKNDAERERIALNGYKRTLSLETYKNKMEDLLNKIWFKQKNAFDRGTGD